MYLGKTLFYKTKHNYRSFGIKFVINGYLYTEYELRLDFWKWSLGIVF